MIAVSCRLEQRPSVANWIAAIGASFDAATPIMARRCVAEFVVAMQATGEECRVRGSMKLATIASGKKYYGESTTFAHTHFNDNPVFVCG
jgi:hypothetical protein